jgi:DNA-binding IclR family transcriptional regulator
MPLGALGWIDMRNDTAVKKLPNRSEKIPVQSKNAPDSHRRNHSDDNIKSMVKIVPILECFSTVDRRLPVAEVVRRTGLPRATAHRIISTLREIGFLDQDKERDHYRLGLKLFELGSIVLASMDLHREAQPFVDALARLSGEAVNLTVFNGTHSVIIRRSEPDRDRLNQITTLETVPAYCSSSGKATLAFQPAAAIEKVISLGLLRFTAATITERAMLLEQLEKIRELGYAIDNEEHQSGVRCIGAPIRDTNGRVFAAISVTGAARRITPARLGELAPLVMHHANAISAQLGYRPGIPPTARAGARDPVRA